MLIWMNHLIVIVFHFHHTHTSKWQLIIIIRFALELLLTLYYAVGSLFPSACLLSTRKKRETITMSLSTRLTHDNHTQYQIAFIIFRTFIFVIFSLIEIRNEKSNGINSLSFTIFWFVDLIITLFIFFFVFVIFFRIQF